MWKNTKKSSRKPCPNREKIHERVMLFFDVALFTFWPRFGRIWGSKMVAKIALLALKRSCSCHFEVSKGWYCCKKASWRPPESIRKPPEVDLGGSRDDFGKILLVKEWESAVLPGYQSFRFKLPMASLQFASAGFAKRKQFAWAPQLFANFLRKFKKRSTWPDSRNFLQREV